MSDILKDLVAKVREIAAADPTHVYVKAPLPDGGEGCRNWVLDDNGNKVGSCIIGRAFLDLGYSDIDDGDDVTSVLMDLDVEVYIDEWNQDDLLPEVGWLSAVQWRQDGGMPWGTAVEKADLFGDDS